MKITINGDPATNYFTVIGAVQYIGQFLDASVLPEQKTEDANMHIEVNATEPFTFICKITTAHDLCPSEDQLWWDGSQWVPEDPRHDVSTWDDENLEMMVAAINRNPASQTNSDGLDAIWPDLMSVMRYLCLQIGSPTDRERILHITHLINTLSEG